MSYQKKVKPISTKAPAKDLPNKFSILNGRKYFSSGIFQNYFVFIPARKYIKYFSGTARIDSWKCNRISEENIENITKSDGSFATTFVDHHILPSIPKKVINLINPQLRNLSTDFTLSNCLFQSVKLTKNTDLDKYKYSGYGIRFDSRSKFSLPDGSMGKNVIVFGGDMSSSVHIDNKGKDILILCEGPTQELNDTTLTAETVHPINFTQSNKRFV